MRELFRLWRDERGNTAMMIAVSAPVIIGALGLGVDASMGYFAKEKMQNAADQAALSAAKAYVADHSVSLTSQAEFIADKSGFGLDDGATVVANNPPSSGPNTGDASYLEVLISQDQPQFFSAIFGDRPQHVTARAVARFSKGSNTCVLVLENSASKAVNMSGGSFVDLTDCDMQVNSLSATAYQASGGAALAVENLMLSGGASIWGPGAVIAGESFQKGVPQVSDPYAGYSVPAPATCKATNYNTSSPATLDPGTYCGGFTVKSGGDVFLRPGVYVINGGKLTVSGGGKLVGHNVTIVFTSNTGTWGGAIFSGSSIVELDAPLSGDTAGFTMMASHSMPKGTKFDFSGGSSQKLDGIVYVPNAFVNYSGGTTATTSCTMMVSNTLQFSGSAAFATDACGKYGKSMGSSSIELAE